MLQHFSADYKIELFVQWAFGKICADDFKTFCSKSIYFIRNDINPQTASRNAGEVRMQPFRRAEVGGVVDAANIENVATTRALTEMPDPIRDTRGSGRSNTVPTIPQRGAGGWFGSCSRPCRMQTGSLPEQC